MRVQGVRERIPWPIPCSAPRANQAKEAKTHAYRFLAAVGSRVPPVCVLCAPPMPNLRSQLSDLASSFTDAVIDALRTTSLHELLSESGARTQPARSARAEGAPKAAAKTVRPASSGRLPRRSANDIAAELDRIVTLVQKHKDGLRAEQIRTELGLQAKELPRVLKEGLSARKLRSKGQKRATTYFAK